MVQLIDAQLTSEFLTFYGVVDDRFTLRLSHFITCRTCFHFLVFNFNMTTSNITSCLSSASWITGTVLIKVRDGPVCSHAFLLWIVNLAIYHPRNAHEQHHASGGAAGSIQAKQIKTLGQSYNLLNKLIWLQTFKLTVGHSQLQKYNKRMDVNENWDY